MIEVVDFEKRVRNILGTSSNTVGDEVISSSEYKGMAEITIKNNVPNWEELDTNKLELLEMGIVLQTALYLLPITQEQKYKSKQTTHAKVEYADTETAMEEMISERLSQILIMLSDEDYSSPKGTFVVSNPDKRYYGVGV